MLHIIYARLGVFFLCVCVEEEGGGHLMHSVLIANQADVYCFIVQENHYLKDNNGIIHISLLYVHTCLENSWPDSPKDTVRFLSLLSVSSHFSYAS